MITCLGFAVSWPWNWILSLSQPTVSWGWSVRWLPLCMAQNGLLRCPEETINWLSCFKAAGLGAGIVMMSPLVFRSAKEERQWDSACFTQLPVLMWKEAGPCSHGFAQMLCIYDKLLLRYCLIRVEEKPYLLYVYCTVYMCVWVRCCMFPLGLSYRQCNCSVMSSKKQADTLLALLNKRSAQ